MRKQDWIVGPVMAASIVWLNRSSAFVKPTLLESFLWFLTGTAVYYVVSALIHYLRRRRRA